MNGMHEDLQLGDLSNKESVFMNRPLTLSHSPCLKNYFITTYDGGTRTRASGSAIFIGFVLITSLFVPYSCVELSSDTSPLVSMGYYFFSFAPSVN